MNDKVSLPDFPISPSVFDMAATECGFVTMKASKLIGLGVVGEALKKMGVVKIGRASLLLSDEAADQVFKLCGDFVSGKYSATNGGIEPTIGQRLHALEIMNTIAGSRGRMAEAMIKSASIDLSDSAKPAGGIPSFLPRAKTIPVVTAEVILEAKIDQAKRKDSDGESRLSVQSPGGN